MDVGRRLYTKARIFLSKINVENVFVAEKLTHENLKTKIKVDEL